MLLPARSLCNMWLIISSYSYLLLLLPLTASIYGTLQECPIDPNIQVHNKFYFSDMLKCAKGPTIKYERTEEGGGGGGV